MHNYVINKNNVDQNGDAEDYLIDKDTANTNFQRSIQYTIPHLDYLPSVQAFADPPPGTITVRDAIYRHIHAHAILRPSFNLDKGRGVNLEDPGLV